MRILAIDPGTIESGYVIWDTSAAQVYDSGIVENNAMVQFVNTSASDSLAIEMIASYGMPVGKEVFDTCVWIGRFMQSWSEHHQEFVCTRVYRKDVKIHLCGTTKAKDGNIRQALIDKLGPVGTKKNPGPLFGISSHKWAALGVAITSLKL